MHTPILSIIIPVYNAETFIPRLIKCIKKQSWQDFEAIIIDDGSTDRTWDISIKETSDDKRFKVYKKENGGPSSSRNYGINLSKGIWIAFIDADDYIEDDYFTVFFKYNINDIKTQVIQGFKTFNERQIIQTFKYCDSPTEVFKNTYSSFLETSHALNRWEVWGKLFSSEIIKTHNLKFDENIHIYEDGIFWHQYILLIDHLIFLPDTNYRYFRPEFQQTLTTRRIISHNELIYITQHYQKLSYLLIEHFSLQKYSDEIIRLYINRFFTLIIHINIKKYPIQIYLNLCPSSFKYFKIHQFKEVILCFCTLLLRIFKTFIK